MGDGVGEAVGFGVAVAVGLAVGFGDGVGEAVGFGVDVAVGVAVGSVATIVVVIAEDVVAPVGFDVVVSSVELDSGISEEGSVKADSSEFTEGSFCGLLVSKGNRPSESEWDS